MAIVAFIVGAFTFGMGILTGAVIVQTTISKTKDEQ